jgi:hypothetical protein
MSPASQILFTLSSFSNLLPIISLVYLFNKLDKAFKIYLLVLIIGSSNDLLGYLRLILGFKFNYMLINDIHEIINYGMILYFFYILNQKKYLDRYFIIFLIGLLIQNIDWFFITKSKYNTIYADLFYYSVCSYLSFDRINYQIINTKKINHNVDWLLVFCITICIYYSYSIYTLALYCLNIPLKIKIEPSLYYILNIVNMLANITLAIVVLNLFKKKRSSFII